MLGIEISDKDVTLFVETNIGKLIKLIKEDNKITVNPMCGYSESVTRF